MAVVIKPITVEVSKPNIFQAIAAKQNDCNSRFLKVTFVNEGEKIFITPAAKVTINAIRNDGKSESFFGTVNADGTATVPIHSWILELVGDVTCDVSIIEADSKLTCTSFSLLIEKATRNSDDVSQDPQYDVLTELIKSVNVLDDEMIAYTESTYTKIPRTVALESRTSAVEKRVTNLEQGILPSPFETDSGVAYQKSVPTNALPYAEVEKIGGMTRKCTNLISFPYADGTRTTNGITFTVNNDGSITVNGTATGFVYFLLYETNNFNVTKGVLTGIPKWPDQNFALRLRDTEAMVDIGRDYGEGLHFETSAKKVQLSFAIQLGTVINNVTVYPMLNEGSTALPYEPYFEGLRSAPVEEVESVGVNLFSPPTIGVRIDSTNGAELKADTFASTDFIRVDMSNGNNYYISGLPNDLYNFVAAYDNSKNYLGRTGAGNYTSINLLSRLSGEVSNIADVAYIRATIYETSTTTGTISSVANLPLMLNKGSTALPYSPYVRNTLPIPSAVQALEGYGEGINESVYNYIDLEKKQFVKRVGKVDLGTLEWYKSELTNNRWCFRTNSIVDLKDTKGVDIPINAICSLYNATSQASTWGDKNIAYYNTSGNTIAVMNNDYTDATAFRNAMGNVNLYYELKTPIITDISDILSEDNYIGVEGGGTVTMVNEHQYSVPSSITYKVKGDA